MGDDYGKKPKPWAVHSLLVNLIQDNYTDLIKVNSEGFAKLGRGVVTVIYPEDKRIEGAVRGQLGYVPQAEFIETMRKSFSASKYDKIVPGSMELLKAYEPDKYMVLGLFGGEKPFVMMLACDSNPEHLIETIESQVQKETADNN